MNIREVRLEDAKKYLEMLKKLDTETKYMMYEAYERKTSVEEQKKKIRENIERNNPVFIALVDERIVGFLEGRRGGANRVRHSIYIAIGVLKDYRGMGIGRALMNTIDDWSIRKNLKRIELTVICENTRALRLYKSMGYELEGIKKGGLIIDGKLVDEYYMGKIY